MKKQQSGFTLVEVAIVMVIIGLLLGGVLKGQEVITNARLKNINNDYSGVSAAIYSYQDRYAAMPGDDVAADAHVNAATNGDGDGFFDTVFNSGAAGDESGLAWAHLRSAGLVNGEADDETLPQNAFNGVIGISTGDNGGGEDVTGITGMLIGFSNIPASMAIVLDSQNDDGIGDTGTVRAVTAADLVVVGGNNVYDLPNEDIYELAFEL